MPSYQQAERFLTVTTPLGPDKLLLVGLLGTEAISQLFQFQLDLIATHDTKVPFDQVLGKKVTAHIRSPEGKTRHFSGICNRFAQGGRDATFTSYRLEIVPELWFLTRRTRSRIFQQISVKDILSKVFEGLTVQYQLTGKYESRDYCVQYRESDFDFASRLMEEEGIFYFFKHEAGTHTMIVADDPKAHLDVPFDSTAIYEPGGTETVDEDRITRWEKTQDLRSMKVTLWDHCFELPHKHLEAEKQIQESVQVGTVSHKLKLGSPDRLELYDWPGAYAQRFDGVDPGRGDRPQDVQKIFQDNQRTAQIRIQEEGAGSLMTSGVSGLRQLTAGHKFTLSRHFDADGPYVVTSASHTARMDSDYRSGDSDGTAYENQFTAIPAALPFRPARMTPRPVVHGTQTAVVVGPKGEELYTDKYGRVKVQFHWDREGKNDAESSCWIRVAQPVAGRRWGTSFWPRIGQEVIVDYFEGDPDQPIIVGCVYNAEQMPPYLGKGPDSKHPDDNKVTGFKSNTTAGGSGFNEWRFDDTKEKQQIFIHAERNMDTRVKKDCMELVEGDRHLIVGEKTGNQYEQVAKDKHLHVKENQVEKIDKTMILSIGGTLDHSVGGKVTEKFASHDLTIAKDRKTQIGASDSLSIAQNYQEKVGMKHAVEAGQEIHLKAGMNVVIEAGVSLTLKGPGGFININPTGVAIQGTMVLINSGGAAGPGSGSSPESPDQPKEAQPKEPTQADNAVTGQKSC